MRLKHQNCTNHRTLLLNMQAIPRSPCSSTILHAQTIKSERVWKYLCLALCAIRKDQTSRFLKRNCSSVGSHAELAKPTANANRYIILKNGVPIGPPKSQQVDNQKHTISITMPHLQISVSITLKRLSPLPASTSRI